MSDYQSRISPARLPAWQLLEGLASLVKDRNIIDLFNENPNRCSDFSIHHNELLLDFSKNLITDQAFSALVNLAEQSFVDSHLEAMCNGEPINTTEHRAALHMALRGHKKDDFRHDGKPVHEQVERALQQMSAISEQVREGKWVGSTGKEITDVVHLGVGGSDLGPRMACQALRAYAHNKINIHFVSNADGAEILSTVKVLNPETTLVLIVSKSFGTQETMLNAQTALAWLGQLLGLENPQGSPHVIAITANRQEALRFGINPSRILEFQEWVGGRYSLWSSVGLSVSICIGYENFKSMLEGAREMDIHYKTAPLKKNMPVIMALVNIWYNNFLDTHTQAVIPYCERLTLLPSYLQQLEMESNGKSVSMDGEYVTYETSPIIWGQTGTDSQHAFFQLLHQGTHYVPVDFVGFINDSLSNEDHHNFLLSNLLAQASALMTGTQEQNLPTHKYYKGNKPSNILLLKELTPTNFGALIALYEHKVFVQGSIWNINSYDQWGVELGKNMTKKVLISNLSDDDSIDPSTKNLHNYIRENTK